MFDATLRAKHSKLYLKKKKKKKMYNSVNVIFGFYFNSREMETTKCWWKQKLKKSIWLGTYNTVN